jgi:hypothetical protein
MKDVTLAHLRNMWGRYPSPEWKRVLPILQVVVGAQARVQDFIIRLT